MREAFAEGHAAVAGVRDPAERLRRFARLHLARLGGDRNLAIVFQVELRQSVKFMERFSSTLLRDYLGQIRGAIADGQQSGAFRADLPVTAATKMFFGALDEMATNWILSKRRYSLEAEADHVVDLFPERSAPEMTGSAMIPMMRSIRSAAVLGAGTMGAQIAALLANVGIPTRLLDLTREVARDGLERATALRPDPFFTRDAAALITTGGFDRDLSQVGGVDWIIEAIVEQIEIKRSLLEHVERVRREGTIVSSNTSGIPIDALAEGRGDEFKRHWLGTHFFNPPRHLRLLEVIPTPTTDPAVVERLSYFADHRLGKGVVVAKDTPNFIANRIGLFGVVQTLRTLESGEYTIEEIDAMTGPVLGRPKSATLRTLDIAGLDVLGHVVRNLAERLTDEESHRAFELPLFVQAMIEREWIGEKAGQGFYKRPAALTGCRGTRQERWNRNSVLGSRVAVVPSQAAGTPRVARRCVVHRRCRPAPKDAVSRARQGRRFSASHAWADSCLHRSRRPRNRPLDRRC